MCVCVCVCVFDVHIYIYIYNIYIYIYISNTPAALSLFQNIFLINLVLIIEFKQQCLVKPDILKVKYESSFTLYKKRSFRDAWYSISRALFKEKCFIRCLLLSL